MVEKVAMVLLVVKQEDLVEVEVDLDIVME
jgi:hypothetical protein